MISRAPNLTLNRAIPTCMRHCLGVAQLLKMCHGKIPGDPIEEVEAERYVACWRREKYNNDALRDLDTGHKVMTGH